MVRLLALLTPPPHLPVLSSSAMIAADTDLLSQASALSAKDCHMWLGQTTPLPTLSSSSSWLKGVGGMVVRARGWCASLGTVTCIEIKKHPSPPSLGHPLGWEEGGGVGASMCFTEDWHVCLGQTTPLPTLPARLMARGGRVGWLSVVGWVRSLLKTVTHV